MTPEQQLKRYKLIESIIHNNEKIENLKKAKEVKPYTIEWYDLQTTEDLQAMYEVSETRLTEISLNHGK